MIHTSTYVLCTSYCVHSTYVHSTNNPAVCGSAARHVSVQPHTKCTTASFACDSEQRNNTLPTIIMRFFLRFASHAAHNHTYRSRAQGRMAGTSYPRECAPPQPPGRAVVADLCSLALFFMRNWHKIALFLCCGTALRLRSCVHIRTYGAVWPVEFTLCKCG